MLEACIAVPRKGEDRLGDVIVVCPAGAPWGTMDRSYHVVVQWDDPELAAKLEERLAAGKRNPAISYPYAVYQEVRGEMIGGRQDVRMSMVMESSVAIDFSLLSPDLQQIIFDENRMKEVIPWDQIRHAIIRR